MKQNIKVNIVDEVFFYVDCDEEQARELYNHVSCMAPNFQFHPKFRAKLWNGRISFFDAQERLLPIGLLKNLMEFADKYNYDCQFNFDVGDMFNEFNEEEIDDVYEKLFGDTEFEPRDYQHEAIMRAFTRKRGVIVSPTGCHAKNTKVVMSDGSVKKVQKVQIGDRLMGQNGCNYREVKKLFRGKQTMYRIWNHKLKQSFEVNEDHILHLEAFRGASIRALRRQTTHHMTVGTYMQMSKTFQRETCLVHNHHPMCFETMNKLTLDPYFVGLYLGDGHTRSCAITTNDPEIKLYLSQVAVEKQLRIRKVQKPNSNVEDWYLCDDQDHKAHQILAEFQHYGLVFGNKQHRTTCSEKFIPDDYKCATIEQRLQLLAGLMDSDGHLNKSTKTYFEFISKSSQLCEDVVFVGSSLGFVCPKMEKQVNGVTYFGCKIIGPTHLIPTKIARKRATSQRQPNKRYYVSSFDIEPIGEGDFYGFELDGNHLYWTSDYILHHNSGKSLIIYTLIRLILLAQSCRSESDSILLIVPNVSLVEQMFSDFREYGWSDIDKYVGILYAGKELNLEKPVLISTWQSVHKRKPSFFWMFGALLIDECHVVKAHSVQQIAKKCINAEYRIGFTGTLPTIEADQYNIFGYLGPKIFDISTKTLMDKGMLSQITIGNILLKYPPKVVKELEGASYPHETRFLIDYAPRNRVFDFIVDSFEEGENALILCQRIKHLKKIEAYARERFPKYDVFTIFKDIKVKDREAIRKSMEHRGNTIIIGTYATTSTGINIKNLHHVIFASSYKSKIKILQSIGRGLRKHESKDHLILWDIIDNLSWIGPQGGVHKNHVYKHFDQRLEYYKDQGFENFNKTLDLQKINSSERT